MEQIIHLEQMTDHPEWNESYYFVFYNKTQKIGGMSRIGFKPNKKEGMTFFFLFLPDGTAAGYHQEIKLKDFTSKLKVKGMSHGWSYDNNWNYKFKGNMIFVKNPLDLPKVRNNPNLILKVEQVSLDLMFTPINDAYEYSKYMTPESLEIGKKSGDKHWEQIGIVSGDLKIGMKNYNFRKVIGQRDHTYGVRDWTGVGNWLYYVIWFNQNLAINPAAIVLNDGRLSTGGFMFKNGKNIPLKAIKIIEQNFQPDEIYPVDSKLEIVDFLGDKHILKAQVGPIIPITFHDNEGNKSILIQSFGEFELDDLKGGYGTFETLRKVIKK
ncbi:MAG: hypothetical protein ACFE85_02260 [Candidatus Hodarchaeota archaeon]